jgi:hypothetical protein
MIEAPLSRVGPVQRCRPSRARLLSEKAEGVRLRNSLTIDGQRNEMPTAVLFGRWLKERRYGPPARAALAANLIAPSGESIRESAAPGRAFLELENGAPAIVINEGNAKPGPLFEQLQVLLKIGIDGR